MDAAAASFAGSAPGTGSAAGPATATASRDLAGRRLHPIGFGLMPLSVPGRPDEARALATVEAALDAGVTLLDTADAYALDEDDVGHGERLIGRLLKGRREEVVVATKGGHVRRGVAWELDGRPEHLRAACETSLRNLGDDAIDLYQLHRPDPKVPFAESVGALRELRDAGLIRDVGLSNVTVAQIEEAERIVPIAAVQNELSLSYAAPLDNGEVAACEARGIPLLAWSPLGGIAAARHAPGEAEPVCAAAERHGVSAQRVVLAWLLALSPAVLPIPGSSRPETIRDSAAAAGLELDPDELAAISSAADRTPRPTGD